MSEQNTNAQANAGVAPMPVIDGPMAAPDRLTVRGKSLNDLVGQLSYPAAVYHLLTGELPTPATAHQLDAWLLAVMRSVPPEDPLAQTVRHSAQLGATDIGAVLAALALGDGLGLPPTVDFAPLDALGLHPYHAGLYYFALAPLLHAYALEAGNDEGKAQRLALLHDPAQDYVGAIYGVVSGKPLSHGAARVVFEAVLVAFHAGLGELAPTIVLPRGAISTRASVAMALAAGYTAAGPAHVGACKVVMGDFMQMVASAPSVEADELVAHTRAALDARLASGGRVAGFGHPLFRQDPRNPHLRDLVKAEGLDSPYLIVYDTVAARMHELRAIHPNIDAIAAALFLTLGIAPPYGTALFLCARMAAMVAHIEDARHAPAFGARRAEREKKVAR